MLKRAFIATAVTLVMAASAAAADLPFKAAPVRATAPIGWTGFYLGATVGGVWSNDDVSWAANPALFGIAFTPVLNASGTGTIDSSGVTVGGTVGFNQQLGGAMVWGLEGDISYTDLAASRSVAVPPPGVAGTVVTSTFESKWLATARGRLGFLATPDLLLFVTGGAAFADIRTSDFAFFAFDGSTNAASGSNARVGWTLGGGGEWRFGRWSAKAEYLHVDLGEVNYTSQNSLPINAGATINHNHRITEDLARVGLNYHLP